MWATFGLSSSELLSLCFTIPTLLLLGFLIGVSFVPWVVLFGTQR